MRGTDFRLLECLTNNSQLMSGPGTLAAQANFRRWLDQVMQSLGQFIYAGLTLASTTTGQPLTSSNRAITVRVTSRSVMDRNHTINRSSRNRSRL
jgi:hypothetical protein